MKKVYKFFWWCAVVTIPEFEKPECAIDHNKYMGIGTTILFTAIMASYSGGYAFYFAIHSAAGNFFNILTLVIFGIFWGCLIFNLDRFIISSSNKGDGTFAITKAELINSSTRIILAAFTETLNPLT